MKGLTKRCMGIVIAAITLSVFFRQDVHAAETAADHQAVSESEEKGRVLDADAELTEETSDVSDDIASDGIGTIPPTQDESENGDDGESEDERNSIGEGTKEVQKIWEKIDGSWYLLGHGEKMTDWQLVKNKWYYLNEKGVMQSGWLKLKENWYYLGGPEDGARKSGWQYLGGKWYYLDEDGIMLTGWQQIHDGWYYLNGSGAMQYGWKRLEGEWYYFGSAADGARKDGWCKVSDIWYFMDDEGVMQTGWEDVDDTWYYLNGSGAMQTGWKKLGGKWYYMNGSGAMQSGWQKLDGKWYYLGDPDDGSMKTGWQEIDEKWYYFYSDGSMASNTFIGVYWVNASGEWIEGAEPEFTLKGNAKLTFYDGSPESNGGYAGRNSSGANGGNLALGQVSCSRSYIPAHTIIYIETANTTGEGSYANGKYFYVADTGVTGAHVDVCVPGETLVSRNYALGHAPYGAGRGDVYIVKYDATWEEYKSNFFPRCSW